MAVLNLGGFSTTEERSAHLVLSWRRLIIRLLMSRCHAPVTSLLIITHLLCFLWISAIGKCSAQDGASNTDAELWPSFANGRVVSSERSNADSVSFLYISKIVDGKVQKPQVLCKIPESVSSAVLAVSPNLRYCLAYPPVQQGKLNAFSQVASERLALRIIDTATMEVRDVSMHDVGLELISWSPDGNDALLVSAAENSTQQAKRYTELTKGIFHGPIYTVLDCRSGTFVRLLNTPVNEILLIFWSPDGKSLLILADVKDGRLHGRQEVFFRVALLHREAVKLGAITRVSANEVDHSISPYLRKLIAVWKDGKTRTEFRSPLVDFYQTTSQSIAVAPLSKKVFMSSEVSPPFIESAAVAVAGKSGAIWTPTKDLGEANAISFWSSDEKHVFFLGRTAPRPERLSTWVWLDPFTGKADILPLGNRIPGEPIQIMP